VRADPPAVLINNAGAGVYGAFTARPLDPQLASIDLNVRALVALSHAYATACGGRPGALLLVASTAGFFPVPYETVYAATKAFVIQFGEALAEEWRGSALIVRTLCPGFTATDFARRAGLPARVVLRGAAHANDVAAAGLAALGGRRVTVAHGRWMTLAGAVSALVPRGVARRAAGWWMRRGLGAPD
jgi:short-subunit dehydrogenase